MGTMTTEYTDLHELAKGWKAAIARATDPATKYVSSFVIVVWIVPFVTHIYIFFHAFD